MVPTVPRARKTLLATVALLLEMLPVCNIAGFGASTFGAHHGVSAGIIEDDLNFPEFNFKLYTTSGGEPDNTGI